MNTVLVFGETKHIDCWKLTTEEALEDKLCQWCIVVALHVFMKCNVPAVQTLFHATIVRDTLSKGNWKIAALTNGNMVYKKCNMDKF